MQDAIMNSNAISVEGIRRVFPDQAEKVSLKDMDYQPNVVKRSLEEKRYRESLDQNRSRAEILGLKPGDLVKINGVFYKIGTVRDDGKICFIGKSGAYSPNLLPIPEGKWRLATNKKEQEEAAKYLHECMQNTANL